MPSIFHHTYNEIISLDNILSAYQEFLRGKRNKLDVQEFSLHLMDNIIALHEDLQNKTFQHGSYEDFYVNDPKRRHIHKASVRDRLLHHAVYRLLYPFFDKTFIPDSFSCRKDKGTHKALDRFTALAYQVSQNHTKTCFILKCDIKQFFASINHHILTDVLKEYILDKDIIWLLENIVSSFSICHSDRSDRRERSGGISRSLDGVYPERRRRAQDDNTKHGLPLGNLTSQLFANIYLNTFDQFIKHQLKIKHYLRYADDFVILSTDRKYLENLITKIQQFLLNHLKLTLHPHKVFIKTMASGVDWLGWVHFPHHRILRTKTKRKMFKRLLSHPIPESVQSYLGMLKWGNTFKMKSCLFVCSNFVKTP